MTSPAQDKPVAASVKWEVRHEDGVCYICERNGKIITDSLPFTEATYVVLNVACEAHNRGLSASSPSEQKSSLTAETLSAQERQSQETGDLIQRLDEILIHAESAVTADLPSEDIKEAFEQIIEIADRSRRLDTILNPRSQPLDVTTPTGSSVASPKSKSAASVATPKENQ